MPKDLTPDQLKFLELCRQACAKFSERAEEAAKLNLPVLAREWDYYSKELELRIEMQLRSFREDTLLDEQQRVIVDGDALEVLQRKAGLKL
jgi:hypothetical protein